MIDFCCLCMLIHDYNLQRIWKSHQNYHHLKLLLMNLVFIWLWNFSILIYHPQKNHNEKISWIKKNNLWACLLKAFANLKQIHPHPIYSTNVYHTWNRMQVIFVNMKYWKMYNKDQVNTITRINHYDLPIKINHIFLLAFFKNIVSCVNFRSKHPDSISCYLKF